MSYSSAARSRSQSGRGWLCATTMAASPKESLCLGCGMDITKRLSDERSLSGP